MLLLAKINSTCLPIISEIFKLSFYFDLLFIYLFILFHFDFHHLTNSLLAIQSCLGELGELRESESERVWFELACLDSFVGDIVVEEDIVVVAEDIVVVVEDIVGVVEDIVVVVEDIVVVVEDIVVVVEDIVGCDVERGLEEKGVVEKMDILAVRMSGMEKEIG